MNDVFSALFRYIEGHRLVAITGGGGKTSLMFFLARRLCERAGESVRVITGTSTKICEPLPSETGELLIGPYDAGRIEIALSQTPHVTIGSSIRNGKMIGFPAETFDALHSLDSARFIIVEADGARNLPFKVYEDHEPVIPLSSSLQIVVVGAEAFVQPLSEENTFRFNLLKERYRPDGGRIPLETIVRILDDPSEYLRSSPAAIKRLLLINKCDLLHENEMERISSRLASSLAHYDHLALCSLRENVCCFHTDVEGVKAGSMEI